MNRAAGVLKMHMRDKFSWFYLPWIICLLSFSVNLVIAAFLQDPEGLYTGGLSSIFVYLFVAGIITLPQTFSFTLGMGVRRKDYFLGTAALMVVVSLVTSVILILLSLAEQYWTNGWGVKLHFFHLPFITEGPVILQMLTFFLLLLFMQFFGFLIASVHRKFGRNGTYLFFGVLLVISAVSQILIAYYDWWDEIWLWFESNFRNITDLAPWLLLPIAGYAAASYVLLRRSTV